MRCIMHSKGELFPSKLEEPRVYSCTGSGTGDVLDVTVANGDALPSALDDASAVVFRAQPSLSLS